MQSMPPKEQNVIDTLNLLVLLFRSRKTTLPRLSEEESHTLFVTKEHLEGAKISIPIFINTLEILATKGYLAYVPMHEQKMHDDITNFKNSPSYAETIDKVRQNTTEEQNTNLKTGIATIFENTIPKHMSYDTEGLMADPFTIADLFEQGLKLVASQSEQTISIIILMPFRSVERLLEKMNGGMRFDDVQDAGIWYDSDNKRFHFGEESIDTVYQGEPSKVHFVLDSLFNQKDDGVIDFSSNTSFDVDADSKQENKRFYLSLNHFIKKHPELSKIFTLHADRLEINKDYLEHIN